MDVNSHNMVSLNGDSMNYDIMMEYYFGTLWWVPTLLQWLVDLYDADLIGGKLYYHDNISLKKKSLISKTIFQKFSINIVFVCLYPQYNRVQDVWLWFSRLPIYSANVGFILIIQVQHLQLCNKIRKYVFEKGY